VISGHTVFKAGDTIDPCLAAVVGIVRTRVLWFDDSTLVSSTPQGMYLYAVPHGEPAPVNGQGMSTTILGDGNVYQFVDPNGFSWTVMEGRYDYSSTATQLPKTHTSTDTGENNPEQNSVNVSYSYDASAADGQNAPYVWTVQIQAIHDDPHNPVASQELYNFVTLVDTCKFPKADFTGKDYFPPGADWNGSPGEYSNNFTADLYVGQTPVFVPGNSTVSGELAPAQQQVDAQGSGQHYVNSSNPNPGAI
jgi:hypothetical protein